MQETRSRGELATGLFYVEPDRDDFLTVLNLIDEPLATLPESRVRPSKEQFADILDGLR